MPEIGQCRLCLSNPVELQRSHGIPAAVYRALRDDSGNVNPNPVHVQSSGIVQTSRQATAPLLCTVCEQRFSVAERWVMSNGLQRDNTFPLSKTLADTAPVILSGDGVTIYSASECPGVKIDLLAFFAVSIFWRYAICDWSYAEQSRVKLGLYTEKFRTFLLGLAAFPEHAVLSIMVRPVGSLIRIVRVPHTTKTEGIHLHTFPMLGYAFSLFCGQDISESARKFCIVSAPRNPIVISARLEESLTRSALDSLNMAEASQAKRVGKPKAAK